MTMNIFRIAGDMSHLASFFFLAQRLLESKKADGISLRTQELYLVVFLARYLDWPSNAWTLLSGLAWEATGLGTPHHHLTLQAYIVFMKAFYIAASGAVVYALRYREPWRSTYDVNVSRLDTFAHWKFAVAPCAALAVLINDGSLSDGFFSWAFEVAWAFSIYLEAIAIAPQLIMLTRRGGVENLTSWYVFALGAYRALYVANWVLRWATEPGYTAWIAWVAGAVQTALYADFFYYFVRAKYYGKDLVLPT